MIGADRRTVIAESTSGAERMRTAMRDDDQRNPRSPVSAARRRWLARCRLAVAVVLCSIPTSVAADGELPATVESRILGILEPGVGSDVGQVRYFSQSIDLNEDGKNEIIVYLVGPMVCGTGGCNTLVLAHDDDDVRLITNIALTRPPITAAVTRTHGWRDLVVHVAGGGIVPGYDARLRFDGTTYPTNPTVAPAERVEGEVSGVRVLDDLEQSSSWPLLDGGAK